MYQGPIIGLYQKFVFASLRSPLPQPGSTVIKVNYYLLLRHMAAHHTNTIKIVKHMYMYINT